MLTISTPTFDWSDSSDAVGPVTYQLFVDNNNDFSSPIISQPSLTQSTYGPSQSLADGTYYWKVIAKDGAGNESPGGSESHFTISTTETTPPTIVNTNPTDASVNVPVDSNIQVTFSEPIDPTTIETVSGANSLTLTDSSNIAVPATVTLSQDGRVATLNPSSFLGASRPYTASVNTDVKDLAGNSLPSTTTWGFRTGTPLLADPTLLTSK